MGVERGPVVGVRARSEPPGQRSVSDLARPWRRRLAGWAAVLFVGTFVLDLVLGAASWVPLLYVLPIAVVAALFGVPAGLATGLVSLGLVVLVNVLADGPRSANVYAVLAVIFALVAALAHFRDRPDDELGRYLKLLKKLISLLILALIAVMPAFAQTAPTPRISNVYEVQAAARVEDVNPADAWSTAFLGLLDVDDDDLGRYREVFESIRSYLGTVEARSRAATAAGALADAVRSGELEARLVLGALHDASALEEPERALRVVSSELLLEETNEAVTRIAQTDGGPVGADDLAEVLAFVEAELPGSEAAARLRQHPPGLVVEVERGEDDDPGTVLLLARTAGEASLGMVEELAFNLLLALVTRRRRDRKESVSLVDTVRGHVLEVFGSSQAVVVAAERLEGGATRWELVLGDRRRVEARTTTDGAVVEAYLRDSEP